MSLPSIPKSALGTEYTVDEATGCWKWLKGKDSRGYPHRKAHRRYWAAANGEIPDGYDIHHRCKNPGCVNPEHLEALDPREHDLQHWVYDKGLTLDDLREIRRLRACRDVTAGQLAERYRVHEITIYRYWRENSWNELLGPIPELEPGKCRYCEATITGGKRHRLYCSARCRTYFNNARKRAAA